MTKRKGVSPCSIALDPYDSRPPIGEKKERKKGKKKRERKRGKAMTSGVTLSRAILFYFSEWQPRPARLKGRGRGEREKKERRGKREM